MVRCAEFYERWKKDPNWCEKSKGSVSKIDAYLKVCEELTKRGVEEEFLFRNFTEGAFQVYHTIKDVTVKDEVFAGILTRLIKRQEYMKKLRKGDPEAEPISSTEVREIKAKVTGEETKEKPAKIIMQCQSCDKYPTPCILRQDSFVDNQEGDMPSVCPFGVPEYADWTVTKD
jgi:hypothetical protein